MVWDTADASCVVCTVSAGLLYLANRLECQAHSHILIHVYYYFHRSFSHILFRCKRCPWTWLNGIMKRRRTKRRRREEATRRRYYTHRSARMCYALRETPNVQWSSVKQKHRRSLKKGINNNNCIFTRFINSKTESHRIAHVTDSVCVFLCACVFFVGISEINESAHTLHIVYILFYISWCVTAEQSHYTPWERTKCGDDI